MPDVSPTKWHRAHTTWFFETFLLAPSLPGYASFDPAYAYLFNSYYEAVGPRHPRPQRGLALAAERRRHRALPRARRRRDARPHRRAATSRRRRADRARPASRAAAPRAAADGHQARAVVQPDRPGVRRRRSAAAARTRRAALRRRSRAATSTIGHDGDDFAFDNEWPAPRRVPRTVPHRRPARDGAASGSSSSPTTATAGPSSGCPTAGTPCRSNELGRAALLARRRRRRLDRVHARGSPRRSTPTNPSCTSATTKPTRSRAGATRACRPSSSGNTRRDRVAPGTLHDLDDEVWQWTSSAYLPYPRFKPAPGAVGEYNGKFMSGQMTLRGGARDHAARPHARRRTATSSRPRAAGCTAVVRLATRTLIA